MLDQIAPDAIFGNRMGRRGGRRGGVEGGGEVGIEDALQVRLDLRDVRRHVNPVGRALEPDLVRHLPSTSARTLRGLPLPFSILSGAATTTAPVGGS